MLRGAKRKYLKPYAVPKAVLNVEIDNYDIRAAHEEVNYRNIPRTSAGPENSQAVRYLPPYENFNTNGNRYREILQSSPSSRWKKNIKPTKSEPSKQSSNLIKEYTHQTQWPDPRKTLGAVSAVSFDQEFNAVIFHRVDRVWTAKSFNNMNHFMEGYLGPITENTILALDRKTGKVNYECGQKMFYMPHGLTIDHENNIWLTDVALHQVLKFPARCISDKPILLLGTAFSPGMGKKFCKPTSVAVLRSGDFFVADGYCNSRIVKFSKNGNIILSWGAPTFQGDAHEVSPPNFFAVPHGLTIAQHGELLCVADRENGRVQCFQTLDGTFHSQYHSSIIGDRLFSVDYAPVAGGRLFVVNGPKYSGDPDVQGYVIDMNTTTILSKFAPTNGQFANPHDLAVLQDASEVYVAELDPPNIYKFIAINLISNQNSYEKIVNKTINVVNPAKTVMVEARFVRSTVLIVVTTIMGVLVLLAMFFIIYKKRRRGNLTLTASSDVEYSKLM